MTWTLRIKYKLKRWRGGGVASLLKDSCRIINYRGRNRKCCWNSPGSATQDVAHLIGLSQQQSFWGLKKKSPIDLQKDIVREQHTTLLHIHISSKQLRPLLQTQNTDFESKGWQPSCIAATRSAGTTAGPVMLPRWLLLQKMSLLCFCYTS